MKKKILIIFIISTIGIIATFWFFMGSKNKLYAHVPKESIFVGKISMVGLFKKMSFDKLKKNDLIADAMEKIEDESSELVNQIMEEPEKSGINFRVDPVVFFEAEKNDINNITGGILFAVKSKENIKKFIQDFGESSGSEFSFREDKENGIQKLYPTEENEKYAFAWNDDVLVITFKDGFRNKTSVKNYAENIITLDKADNIYENEGFEKFIKNTNDIDIFINMNQVTKVFNNSELKELFNGQINNMNGFSCHLNFDDDNIDLSFFPYFNNSENALSLLNDPLDDKFEDYITSNGKTSVCFGINLNIEELINLSEPFYRNELNTTFSEYKIKDILKMLSGEIVVSIPEFKNFDVSDFEFDPETSEFYPVQRKRMMPVFNIQLGISKSSEIKKILEFMKDDNENMKFEDEIYSLESEIGKIFIVQLPDRLIISSDPNAARIKSGVSWQKPTKENTTEKLTKNAASLWVSLDLDDYPLKSMGAELSDENIKFMNMMQDLTITADNSKIITRLNLKSGKDNSFYRLINGIIEMNLDDFIDDLDVSDDEAAPVPYSDLEDSYFDYDEEPDFDYDVQALDTFAEYQ